MPVTISLAIGAAVLWLIVGVSTGILSALQPGSFFDRAAMGIALAGVSLPIYFTGLIALTLFSYGWPYLAAQRPLRPITEQSARVGRKT